MKDGADAIAILVRGFWSAGRFHPGNLPLPSDQSSEKWIIFTSGMPSMSKYFDLSEDLSYMLSPAGRAKMQEYSNDTIQYKRLILHALDIYNEIENDEDVALWEVNYSSDNACPGALATSADEYHEDELANYRLSNGAFVKASADDVGLKKGTCFAIEELLETRSVILYPDNRFTRFRKKPGNRIIKENGTIGE